MPTCDKCGGKTSDDAKFCGNCGYPINPPLSETGKESQEIQRLRSNVRIPNKNMLIIGAVCISLILSVWIWYPRSPTTNCGNSHCNQSDYCCLGNCYEQCNFGYHFSYDGCECISNYSSVEGTSSAINWVPRSGSITPISASQRIESTRPVTTRGFTTATSVERISCGENLCPQGWICCKNLEVCYNPKEARPLNCDIVGNSNPNNIMSISTIASQHQPYPIYIQPTPYPVCVNMPGGSIKCPGFGGTWDTVQTPSPLSYAIY